jgi:thioredoxin-dependent peroxiredoxin
VLERGQEAPDFSLQNQDGESVRLSDLRGGPVVAYFYPRADTPGCTTQACGVRDHREDYRGAGATVLGISPDDVPAIKRFHAGQGLNFDLLADRDHAVADAYGVWVEKKMYGKRFWGVERTTFVVDENGRVAEVLRRVKPATHDEQVLAALSA